MTSTLNTRTSCTKIWYIETVKPWFVANNHGVKTHGVKNLGVKTLVVKTLGVKTLGVINLDLKKWGFKKPVSRNLAQKSIFKDLGFNSYQIAFDGFLETSFLIMSFRCYAVIKNTYNTVFDRQTISFKFFKILHILEKLN